MDIAALVAWLVTAGGGFYLFGTWLANGGMSREDDTRSRFPAALIVGHAGFAAAGLIVWIAYLAADGNESLAWVAFGLLIPVALLGFTMFFRWLADRRREEAARSQLAEQRFPAIVVVAHGALAVTTVVLVLLAAVNAGG